MLLLAIWISVLGYGILYSGIRKVSVFQSLDPRGCRSLHPGAGGHGGVAPGMTDSETLAASGPLRACPVAGADFGDSFGACRSQGCGGVDCCRRHEGEDLMAPAGTPIHAAHAGMATKDPNTLGGNAVKISSPAGYSYYAHLASYVGFFPRPVRAGDVIGRVGNSGDAQGGATHLHFEWHPGGGAAVNPFKRLQYLCQELPRREHRARKSSRRLATVKSRQQRTGRRP